MVLGEYTAHTGTNPVVGTLIGLYLGLAVYWGRRSVRRVTRGWGGLAVVGGSGVSSQPGFALLIGTVFGVALWVCVGLVSWPLEVANVGLKLVRLHRASRNIKQMMPQPMLAHRSRANP